MTQNDFDQFCAQLRMGLEKPMTDQKRGERKRTGDIVTTNAELVSDGDGAQMRSLEYIQDKYAKPVEKRDERKPRRIDCPKSGMGCNAFFCILRGSCQADSAENKALTEYANLAPTIESVTIKKPPIIRSEMFVGMPSITPRPPDGLSITTDDGTTWKRAGDMTDAELGIEAAASIAAADILTYLAPMFSGRGEELKAQLLAAGPEFDFVSMYWEPAEDALAAHVGPTEPIQWTEHDGPHHGEYAKAGEEALTEADWQSMPPTAEWGPNLIQEAAQTVGYGGNADAIHAYLERQRLRNAVCDAAMLWHKGVPCKAPNRRQRIAQACFDLEEFEAAQEKAQ